MPLPTACWPLWALLAGTLPPDGRAIVAAMHDRYAGKWYATLTFVQHNTATRPDDSTEHSTWREYAALPGRLRIEFEPLDSGGGVLFVRDSQFVFRGGRLANATAFVHPLMVLGVDRSEEHTSELQSPCKLLCRLLLAKKTYRRILTIL